MYQHIVVPTDGSALSAHAVDQALALARTLGAKVTLMTVVEPFHMFSMSPDQLVDTRDQYIQRAQEEASRSLQDASAKARFAGVIHETIVVENDHPYEAIIETARKQNADLIAMASHGRRGVSALVLGSETLKVLTHSLIPVLVYRHKDA